MDIVEWLREAASEHNMYRCDEAVEEIERLREGFVWLNDTIEGHLLLNPESKDSKLIQEIKRKISFILSNGEE